MSTRERRASNTEEENAIPAFDIQVTTSIRYDIKEMISKIYLSIHHGPGEDNPVLEEAGEVKSIRTELLSICRPY